MSVEPNPIVCSRRGRQRLMRVAVTEIGVPEIFSSIQGEGVSAGCECVFVRLSQCNLHCVWCDTPYTWNFFDTGYQHPKGKFDRESESMELGLLEIVSEIKQYDPRRVVITGGEPLLQQARIVELCSILKEEEASYCFEIETNGTIAPAPEVIETIDQFNVSPKLAHSQNSLSIRRREKALKLFGGLQNAFFKFVLQSENDIDEVLQIVDDFSLNRDRVFLMPEGTNSTALQMKSDWLTNLCRDHKFRFSDRLHIHEFGDTRGT